MDMFTLSGKAVSKMLVFGFTVAFFAFYYMNSVPVVVAATNYECIGGTSIGYCNNVEATCISTCSAGGGPFSCEECDDTACSFNPCRLGTLCDGASSGFCGSESGSACSAGTSCLSGSCGSGNYCDSVWAKGTGTGDNKYDDSSSGNYCCQGQCDGSGTCDYASNCDTTTGASNECSCTSTATCDNGYCESSNNCYHGVSCSSGWGYTTQDTTIDTVTCTTCASQYQDDGNNCYYGVDCGASGWADDGSSPDTDVNGVSCTTCNSQYQDDGNNCYYGVDCTSTGWGYSGPDTTAGSASCTTCSSGYQRDGVTCYYGVDCISTGWYDLTYCTLHCTGSYCGIGQTCYYDASCDNSNPYCHETSDVTVGAGLCDCSSAGTCDSGYCYDSSSVICYTGVSCAGTGWGNSGTNSKPATPSSVSNNISGTAYPFSYVEVTGTPSDTDSDNVKLQVCNDSGCTQILCTSGAVGTGTETSCVFQASETGCSTGSCTVYPRSIEASADTCGVIKNSTATTSSFDYDTMYISIAITFSSGVEFGSLNSGSSNNPSTTCASMACNITISQDTTVDVDIVMKANSTLNQDGMYDIPYASYTWKSADSAQPTESGSFALQGTMDYTNKVGDSVSPGGKKVWQAWLDIPAGQKAGEYINLLSFCACEEDQTDCS